MYSNFRHVEDWVTMLVTCMHQNSSQKRRKKHANLGIVGAVTVLELLMFIYLYTQSVDRDTLLPLYNLFRVYLPNEGML
jgi:hypothetical protein